MCRPAAAASPEGVPFFFTRLLGDNDFLRGHAYYFPFGLRAAPVKSPNAHPGQNHCFTGMDAADAAPTANLSPAARAYLAALRIPNPDVDPDTAGLVWMHALAIGYSPAYLSENADGIRQDWPRIPLPSSRKALLASAALGRKVAALLDTESLVQGVTTGAIRPELRAIGVISRVGGGSLNPDAGDLNVEVGWGHAGKDGVTMPGKGKLIERDVTAEELDALAKGAKALGQTAGDAVTLLGKRTYDVFLNDVAYWKNVPARVWDYTIGGYQVIKKWLSYREADLLGRSLTPEEAREVMNTARRIAAILLLEPALDANYLSAKSSTYSWPKDE
jgi:hypothetical protein